MNTQGAFGPPYLLMAKKGTIMQGLIESDNYIKCNHCNYAHTYGQRLDTGYDVVCPNCESDASTEDLEDETQYYWWSVGIYSTGENYGGPEEGGWWYTAGDLEHHDKVRSFYSLKQAQEYAVELRKWITEHNSGQDYAIKGFTEQFPDAGFPKVRPRYC